MLGVLSGNRTHIKDTSVGERTTLGLCPSVLSLRGYYTGNNNGKIYDAFETNRKLENRKPDYWSLSQANFCV